MSKYVREIPLMYSKMIYIYIYPLIPSKYPYRSEWMSLWTIHVFLPSTKGNIFDKSDPKVYDLVETLHIPDGKIYICSTFYTCMMLQMFTTF